MIAKGDTVFYDDADVSHGHARNYDANGEPVKPGWYYWIDSRSIAGPFATAEDARAAIVKAEQARFERVAVRRASAEYNEGVDWS